MRQRLSLLLCLLVLGAAGFDWFRGSKSEEPPATHVDLLIGHNLLQDSLSGEGGLGMLRIFKKLTFGHVGEDVQNLMKALGKVSSCNFEKTPLADVVRLENGSGLLVFAPAF